MLQRVLPEVAPALGNGMGVSSEQRTGLNESEFVTSANRHRNNATKVHRWNGREKDFRGQPEKMDIGKQEPLTESLLTI